MKKLIQKLLLSVSMIVVGVLSIGLPVLAAPIFPIGGGTGTSTAPGLNSMLIGNSSGVYDVKTLTQGSNITITNSGSTVTISATGGGGGGTFPFDYTSPNLFVSTSTTVAFFNGLFATASSTFSTLLLTSSSTLQNFTARNSTTTNATTTSLYSTTIGANSEYFTDFTGSGLTNVSSALTCATGSSSVFGCLPTADWTKFDNKISSTSIDTLAELETLMSGINILAVTEIDTCSELSALTQTTGSCGTFVLSVSPAFTGTPTFQGFLSQASSTITALTVTNGTTTNATSTNLVVSTQASTTALIVSNLKSCDTIDTDANGLASCGTDSSGGAGAFSFTTTTNFGSQTANSTSTAIWFKAPTISMMASSTSWFDQIKVASTTATSTITGPAVVIKARITQTGACDNANYSPTGGGTPSYLIINGCDSGQDKEVLFADAGQQIWTFGSPGDGAFHIKRVIAGATEALNTYISTMFINATTSQVGYGEQTPTGQMELSSTSPSTTYPLQFTMWNKNGGAGTRGNRIVLTNQSGHTLYYYTDTTNSAVQDWGLSWGGTNGLYMDANANIVVHGSTLTSGSVLTVTGVMDATGGVFTNATSTGRLNIPNGAAPTVPIVGDIGYDSTANQRGQFILGTSTNSNSVAVFPVQQKIWGMTMASTSVDFISGGRLPLPPVNDGWIIDKFTCVVDGGTSVVLNVDTLAGGSNTTTITCATTKTTTAITANTSLASSTPYALEIGTVTGTVDYVSWSAWGVPSRE